jgi:hypothetical protein
MDASGDMSYGIVADILKILIQSTGGGLQDQFAIRTIVKMLLNIVGNSWRKLAL